MQVLEATCSMPIVGDTLILPDKEGADEPEIAKMLDWSRRDEIF